MLSANGMEFRNEQGIFPLIIFQKDNRNFKCIGTCFFINGQGIFVTARHVVVDEVKDINMMFVVQNLSNHQTVNRVVTNLCIHPNADIAVGLVGLARHPITAREVSYERAPSCRLSFKKMEAGTELMGFGYPKTKKVTKENLQTFNFTGTWSTGFVDDYYPDGFSWLQNKCYQTNMVIESGSSGGPVFKDGYVVGINSSSFEMSTECNPISFITPVDYLFDLQLPVNKKLITIKEMAQNRKIIVDY